MFTMLAILLALSMFSIMIVGIGAAIPSVIALLVFMSILAVRDGQRSYLGNLGDRGNDGFVWPESSKPYEIVTTILFLTVMVLFFAGIKAAVWTLFMLGIFSTAAAYIDPMRIFLGKQGDLAEDAYDDYNNPPIVIDPVDPNAAQKAAIQNQINSKTAEICALESQLSNL